ncbi:MAG: uracil phosphoribosyltransferase [Desulfurococcales archaeon]|nr:uracil phosphoribosyltransferase [Desulfurococcales archaeon]
MGGKLEVLGDSLPLARYILRRLRDKSTGYVEFRSSLRAAGLLLGAYISRELEWRDVEVTTPLEAKAVELEPGEDLHVVGVLGASIPLVEGIVEALPFARIGLIAARRVEEGENVRVEVYYVRLPEKLDGLTVIADPMLATGGTAVASVDIAKARGARKVIVASVIAARQGLERLWAVHPDVPVYTLAVDPELNKKFFIVPGLGDAGDRALGD